jgi:hypothetical protein
MMARIQVVYDDKPSPPPPPAAPPKSELRIAVERIQPGYSALFPQHTNEEVSRIVARIHKSVPKSKYVVRKVSGGTRVWRVS